MNLLGLARDDNDENDDNNGGIGGNIGNNADKDKSRVIRVDEKKYF